MPISLVEINNYKIIWQWVYFGILLMVDPKNNKYK